MDRLWQGISPAQIRQHSQSFDQQPGHKVMPRWNLPDIVFINHAKIFLGVNPAPGGHPDRWRLENSWFDQFVYHVVMDWKYLTQKIPDWSKKSPIEPEPWDPMGSLA